MPDDTSMFHQVSKARAGWDTVSRACSLEYNTAEEFVMLPTHRVGGNIPPGRRRTGSASGAIRHGPQYLRSTIYDLRTATRTASRRQNLTSVPPKHTRRAPATDSTIVRTILHCNANTLSSILHSTNTLDFLAALTTIGALSGQRVAQIEDSTSTRT